VPAIVYAVSKVKKWPNKRLLGQSNDGYVKLILRLHNLSANMARLFFALDINSKDKNTIDAWRQANLNLPYKKIPKGNFHITLVFLGNITNEQRAALTRCAGRAAKKVQASGELQLALDQCRWFKRARVLCLANQFTPDWLSFLANELGEQAKSLDVFQEIRPYRPHVSLYRKAKHPAPKSVVPNLTLSISSFSLYQSISVETGVIYKPIKRWSLVKK